MKFEKQIQEYEERKRIAMGMGGPKALEKLKAAGRMNARERLDYLLDPNTFVEMGMFCKSINPLQREKSAADGKIAGFGTINGRMVGVCANDFTVLAASSSVFNSAKMSFIKKTCSHNGYPVIFLGEATGGRIPNNMGAAGHAFEGGSNRIYSRLRESPWVNVAMGPSFGSACWHAVLSDFNVMVKGSFMSVASARVCSFATKEKITSEELGGWRLHAEVSGLADAVADTEEEGMDIAKKFLSYMPNNNKELPPTAPVPAGSDEACANILDLVPETSDTVYNMKKVIEVIVDKGSMFEIKPRYAKNMITTLARIDGRVVGIVANNPYNKAGSMDADACDKVVSFLVLCDSFNIPVCLFVDQPGFLIGVEGERRKMAGKIMTWMNALGLMTVPKIAIEFRKNYGQGALNMGFRGNATAYGSWWMSETSFMAPDVALGVVLNVKRDDDPEAYDAKLKEFNNDNSPYEHARVLGSQFIIDPRETRDYLKRLLAVHCGNWGGIGKHLMHNWPTTI